jgi:release factor glutamine methyltransferase
MHQELLQIHSAKIYLLCNVKVKDLIQLFRNELKGMYSDEEIENFIFYSINEYIGWTRSDLHLKTNQILEEKNIMQLCNVLEQLKEYKPIQYILGSTEFYGCKIKVNKHVLIPRPETEELVDLIIHDTQLPHAQFQNILDIGTGSGCIAIALKKNIPNANVFALDVSEHALLVAKENAILNQTQITFICGDIRSFSSQDMTHSFDIIVSNPPYIRHCEKEKMSKNVLNYEPHIALFVKDDDPLIFYRVIADFAKKNLNNNGKLYFEINETMGNDVKKLLEKRGFKNVEIKKDMNKKDRIAVGEKSVKV